MGLGDQAPLPPGRQRLPQSWLLPTGSARLVEGHLLPRTDEASRWHLRRGPVGSAHRSSEERRSPERRRCRDRWGSHMLRGPGVGQFVRGPTDPEFLSVTPESFLLLSKFTVTASFNEMLF